MAASADLEWSFRGSDGPDGEHSEESDGFIQHPGAFRAAWGGRVLRAAAAGAFAAVVFVCVLTFRDRSGVPAARAADALGLNAVGQEAVKEALQAADTVERDGYRNGKIVPLEHLHDGNPCTDQEEYHGGLCYEKCALLTGGAFIYRQNAWTCCNEATETNVFKMGSHCRHNIGLCSGYDIAGMEEGNKICPHMPGACLADEELFLDVCYMKCSLLTNNEYPFRTAAATCCKSKGLGCVIEDGLTDGFNGQAITSDTLDVGGGCGDTTDKTSCAPHPPEQQLTEG